VISISMPWAGCGPTERCVEEVADEVLAAEFRGARVHGDSDVRQTDAEPVRTVANDLGKYPLTHGDDEAAMFERRQKKTPAAVSFPLRIIAPAKKRFDRKRFDR